MCGIVGYIGGGNAAKTVYEGLQKLEYRGYDSAGIAVSNEGRIHTFKSVGRVQKLNTYAQNAIGNAAIGHTRWATHGKVTNANAHPHTFGRVTVVHNGIIENYAELKSKLSAEGEIFTSDTDSEVIAHLVDRFFGGDLVEALAKCADMLIGSYAILCMCEGVEGIGVAKRRSPAIVGWGEKGNYCASDLPALAGNCAFVSILEDGDFALLKEDGIEIFASDLTKVERPVLDNPAQSVDLSLRGFPHFMLKELWEAPATVKNTITAFREKENEIRSAISGADRIIFTGCGTAYHAALLGKRYAEDFSRLPTEADFAGELRYKIPRVTPGTLLVAVTQSGETADTVEVARLYKSLGAKVIAVTNSPYSAICRVADAVVPVVAGPEICVAATKSYSGQVAALYLFALLFPDGCKDKYEELEKTPDLILKTLECLNIYALADMCAHSRGVYFLGRDIDYAAALEGSLKLKEVSYIPGGGFPAGELKHGTIALIDEKTVSVFVINDPDLSAKSVNGVEQVLARRGKVAVITCLESVAQELADRAVIIPLPACGKYLSPLISAAAMQFLAYRTATVLGYNPDLPRNLAKSVTVE